MLIGICWYICTQSASIMHTILILHLYFDHYVGQEVDISIFSRWLHKYKYQIEENAVSKENTAFFKFHLYQCVCILLR